MMTRDENRNGDNQEMGNGLNNAGDGRKVGAMTTAIAEKLERVLTMADCDRCFASKARETMIDVLHPVTGLTVCFGKTLEDCKREYPDAEEMTVDAFCAWKAERQRTPITWTPTTEKKFMEMLEVLPPELWLHGKNGGFLVGEAYDHDAGTGEPRFQGFRKHGETYETGSRPMTRREFRAALEKAGV